MVFHLTVRILLFITLIYKSVQRMCRIVEEKQLYHKIIV